MKVTKICFFPRTIVIVIINRQVEHPWVIYTNLYLLLCSYKSTCIWMYFNVYYKSRWCMFTGGWELCWRRVMAVLGCVLIRCGSPQVWNTWRRATTAGCASSSTTTKTRPRRSTAAARRTMTSLRYAAAGPRLRLSPVINVYQMVLICSTTWANNRIAIIWTNIAIEYAIFLFTVPYVLYYSLNKQ